MFIFISVTLTFTSNVLAKKKSKKDVKIVYKYKKYQKFDFEDLVIEGDTGGPGDLSVSPTASIKVINKLPYRINFNPEIRKGIERIR